MKKHILIKGGRILDPGQGRDETSDLFISEGRIVTEIPGKADYDVIEAKGMVVCPGFIDLHCHLRQPGFEEKETIASGTRAAARGGFTTVCCMPNTSPAVDTQATVDYVKSEAAANGLVRVLPIGCISKGRKGQELAEMAELAAAGVIGFSDDGAPVTSSRLMRQALDYSRTFGLPVIDHCEDLSLSQDGQMNESILATELGLRGIPNAAEETMVARDIALAELTGAWVHIAHVSTAGSVELVRRAKEKGIKITAEVTPHHLTLTETKVAGYDTNAKVNPPLRTKRDITALIQGLKEGVIDVIATDHAPHTEVDKLCEFALAPSGISGLETAFGSLLGLVNEGHLDLITLLDRLTAAPARILKQEKLGTLAVGAAADIVIFDPDREWVVDPQTFASKGRNTPLAGVTLKGKVMATICGGKIVFKDSSLTTKE